MPNSIEQINQLLPQVSESVLQEVCMILSTATKQQDSSEAETNVVRRHSAFLNGYVPEDEGLYDDY
jgi:hypothetical protein